MFGKNILDIKLFGTGSIYYQDSTNTSLNIVDAGEGKAIKN
jgi:hypothetical protein